MIFTVLFVLPGFLAAGFSRMGQPFVSVNGSGWSRHGISPKPPLIQAEVIVLTPAIWLMKHSEAVSRFYNWQFRLAGGLEFEIES